MHMPKSQKVLLALFMVSCLALAAIGVVRAQTTSDTNSTSATQATSTTTNQPANMANPPAQPDPSKGGHVGANGVVEVLLTGDTAEKVKTSALEAVPGGTILRVENDAGGAVYEAHMTKSDGSQVTVFFDSNYNVTGQEAGPGLPH